MYFGRYCHIVFSDYWLALMSLINFLNSYSSVTFLQSYDVPSTEIISKTSKCKLITNEIKKICFVQGGHLKLFLMFVLISTCLQQNSTISSNKYFLMFPITYDQINYKSVLFTCIMHQPHH